MNERGESTVNSQADEAFGILCSVIKKNSRKIKLMEKFDTLNG